MATPKQVQLRGGTTEEHNAFTGASREITIDTTLNTIRVHDGLLQGGHIICRQQDLDNEATRLDTRIDDMQNNLGGSHNHDDKYVKLGGEGRDILLTDKRALVHTDGKLYLNYMNDFGMVTIPSVVETGELYVTGHRPILSQHKGGYHGMTLPDGNDNDWIRTTGTGLIPFQPGGYSSIGTSGWKFNEGWFNTLNANTINVNKNGNVSRINFSAQQNDPGFIEHYENNNHSTLRVCVSDDDIRSDEIQFGVSPGGTFKTNMAIRGDGSVWARGTLECQSWIAINGIRLYIGSRPSDAPNGSVSIG